MLNEKCIQELQILFKRYPELIDLRPNLISAVELLTQCYKEGGKILICGNGGSAADSLHIVGELMKGFVLKRPISMELKMELEKQYPDDASYYIDNLQQAIPAISLTSEISLLTAYSNDNAADLVFAQQVLGYASVGDVLFGISTSGNSLNVLHAAKIAKALGMKVISLTGASGGKLKDYSDIVLPVPSNVTHQIQEYHLPVYHAICLALEKQIF